MNQSHPMGEYKTNLESVRSLGNRNSGSAYENFNVIYLPFSYKSCKRLGNNCIVPTVIISKLFKGSVMIKTGISKLRILSKEIFFKEKTLFMVEFIVVS